MADQGSVPEAELLRRGLGGEFDAVPVLGARILALEEFPEKSGVVEENPARNPGVSHRPPAPPGPGRSRPTGHHGNLMGVRCKSP